jgi:hypothetical protein
MEVQVSESRAEDRADRRAPVLTLTFNGAGPVMDALKQLVETADQS